jgi:hypothetical protein
MARIGIKKDYPVIPRRQGAVCLDVQDKDKEKYKTRVNIEHFLAE